MVTRSKSAATSRSRGAAPAKKAAAPARKSAPAKKAAPAKAAPAPKTSDSRNISHTPKKPTVVAHDVMKALLTYKRAEAVFLELYAKYWEEYGEVLDGAAEHAEKFLSDIAPPNKQGRRDVKEGPARKALPAEPMVDEYFNRDEVEDMSIRELRDLAKDLATRGVIAETMVKKEILNQMEAAGLFREDGSASADEDDFDDEDEDVEDSRPDDEEDDDADSDPEDDDDDEGDGEEAYTLEDLKEMDLDELQDLAEQLGIPWKRKKQAELIELIMESAEDEDGEEEAEEEEEDDEEYEELELDEDQIRDMSVAELLALLGQLGVKVPVKAKKNKDALIDLVMENLEEEDEDEE